MEIILDALGKACPTPVLMAKKEIESGTRLFGVKVDNTIACSNLKELAANRGYNAEAKADGANYLVVFEAQEQESCAMCAEAAQIIAQKPTAGWAVFVNKPTIGHGSDELGGNLIKMFFYTLAQGDDLPKYILFMNSGVKLTALDEYAEVVEHLKTLSDKGCQLFVCGTCLNYFGLAEQVKIGKVSNMLDITDKLLEVAKVITV